MSETRLHADGLAEDLRLARARIEELEEENTDLKKFLDQCDLEDFYERQTLKAERDTARTKGYREGVTAYAWWKDGVQYVGTCGATLADALTGKEAERG